MLDCYKLLLLSLSLTLSIIIITVIIIISTINAILEGKEKATGTDKTVWTCLYACYLSNNFLVCLFVFCSFSCKNKFILEFSVCKFVENKNKNLLKTKKNIVFIRAQTLGEIFKSALGYR